MKRLAVQCPHCGSSDTEVDYTRPSKVRTITRRRLCKACKEFFHTEQEPEFVKKNSTGGTKAD